MNGIKVDYEDGPIVKQSVSQTVLVGGMMQTGPLYGRCQDVIAPYVR